MTEKSNNIKTISEDQKMTVSQDLSKNVLTQKKILFFSQLTILLIVIFKTFYKGFTQFHLMTNQKQKETTIVFQKSFS
jgi:hypothetical protein